MDKEMKEKPIKPFKEVLDRIRIKTAFQQVEDQLALLSCDDLRVLIHHYGCGVAELRHKVYNDKFLGP